MENSLYTATTDTELIEKVLRGEIAFFELLIRRYNPVLYKIARSYDFNHQDSEDLIQETHIKAYEKLSQFEGRASYKTWISKIMIHKCIYKQKYGYSKNEFPAEQPLVPTNQPLFMKSTGNPEEGTVNKELGIVLEKSLEKLPTIYRSVFVLREIEGFSVKETAELLNVSEVNVKVRMSRAKAMLQTEIESFYSKADIYSFNLIYCDAVVKKVFEHINKTPL